MANKITIFDYPIHPAADIFPMLEDDELAELAEDIKANGLVHPIVVKDGVLIDGRNRREACRRIGIEPSTVELDGHEPAAFILSTNIRRRHMNKSQQAMATAMLFPEVDGKGGRGKKSVLNTEFSRSYIVHARTVLKWLPAIAPAVLAGTKPLNEAYAEAKLIKDRADAQPVRMGRLRQTAPDLAALVVDERMSLNEAEAAAEERQAEADRRKRVFFDAMARIENMLAFTETDSGIEDAVHYIHEFPEDCSIRDPKTAFKRWSRQLSKLSEAL